MIYSVQQIKFEILAHIKEYGGDFHDWYIGISSDPGNTLHSEHRVHQKDDIWLYKRALTVQACRTVQRYFVERLQVDGKLHDLSETEPVNCVYAYKKSARTSP